MSTSRVTFVLVHGACHGAWCWRQVQAALVQEGHQVLVPDLPGLGGDRTPLAEATFAAGVERICDLLTRSAEPVILVGHSLGGMYITQAAEEYPENIRWLAYLSALLPSHGESSLIALQRTAEENPEVLTCAEVDEDAMRLRFPAAVNWFYHDCAPAAIALAERHLKPQPMRPLHTPVTLSRRFAGVPRAYLSCTDDRVLTPRSQHQLYTRTPCERVISLQSGHSPFLSMPLYLAMCLDGLTKAEPTGLLQHA